MLYVDFFDIAYKITYAYFITDRFYNALISFSFTCTLKYCSRKNIARERIFRTLVNKVIYINILWGCV